MRILALAALLALSGCVDYLNHRDSLTLAAGDANDANIAIQTIDPWPPASARKTIAYDGQRAMARMGYYTTGAGGGGYSGNCEFSSQTAANGTACGGRAAEARPGGITPPAQ